MNEGQEGVAYGYGMMQGGGGGMMMMEGGGGGDHHSGSMDPNGGFDDGKPLTSQFRGVCWNKKNRR